MAKHTYGPWFFSYFPERGPNAVVVRRQRFNESGTHMAYDELDGDVSKLAGVLEVCGRAAGLEGIPSLGGLGAAASTAYGRATSATADPPPARKLPLSKALDEEQAAIVGDTGRIPLSAAAAFPALSGGSLWIYSSEARELGLDPWTEISAMERVQRDKDRYSLLIGRNDSKTVSGDFIVYYLPRHKRIAA